MVNVVRDLNSRLGNVHIGKKLKDGKFKPIYVESFWQRDDGTIMLRIYNRDTEKSMDVEWVESEYLLDCPKVGMLFDGEKVYYASRTPQRQWKGGFTPNVVHLETLSAIETREMSLQSKPLNNTTIVNFAYNPEYIGLSDGIKSMVSGKIFSFPLSRKFAVSQKVGSKFPVVYYKSWIVGWVDGDTVVLPKGSAHLIEELSQYASCRRA